ncbi:WG repeat-containing protein, partial [Capnocytophaga granulosa]
MMNTNKQEKYDEITDFHKGFACVRQGDKWGYINEKGTLITPIKYDFVYDFFQGVAMVRIGAQYGLIDTSGKEITPVKYDLIDDNDFYNHRPAAALLNGKWGFINEKGEEVIP